MKPVKPDSPLKVGHSRLTWLALTEVWLYRLIRELPDTIENHVICEHTVNLDRFPVEHIHSLGGTPESRPSLFKKLMRSGFRTYRRHLEHVLKVKDIRLLHTHFGNAGWRNKEVAAQSGVRHVVTFYGYDINRLPTVDPRWLDRYRDLFREADLFLCEGPHMAGSLVSMGCPEKKIRVHHLGIVPEEIPFESRHMNEGSPLKILIASSFREKKGIPDALAAIGRFQSEVPLEVTVIGDADHEERSRVEKQRIMGVIQKYDLEKKVTFLGYRPHDVLVREYYRNHLFLAASRTASDGDTEGGAPVSVIEALASGMIVLSTRHCDIPNIIRDPDWGALAGEGDVEGLLDGLRRLVSEKDNWNEMGLKGRAHVESQFNAHRQGQIQADLYRSICEFR